MLIIIYYVAIYHIQGFNVNKYKNIIFLTIVLFIFEITLFSALKFYNNQKEEAIKNSYIQKLETQLNSFLYYSKNTSSIIIDEILGKKDIKNILKNMNSDDESIKNSSREELYTIFENTYKRLVNHGFRQLHFHDKDGNSFLRFHSKENFGDNLLNVRATIKEANHTKKLQFGFEEGKVQNGFRNVFPIIIDNEFLGTVELSNSFETIHHTLHKIFPYEYKLIISKKYVDKKLFSKSLEENYKISPLSDDFYEEKIYTCEVQIIDKASLSKIDAKIKKLKLPQLNSFKSFTIPLNIDDNNYILNFLAIPDFDKSVNTYLVSYSKDSSIFELKKELYINLLVFNLVLFSIIIFYFLRVNFIEKNIFIKKAYTDILTGLNNRAKFNTDIEAIVSKEELYKYSLILYDIDFFKKVNDTYGHDIGDIVLQEFSNVTKASLRSDDLVYRWGGEEFIAIIKSTLEDDLYKIGEKMRVAVETYSFTGVKNLTSSFGIAISNKNDDIDTLIKKADEALYKAKNTGRNKIVINKGEKN